MAIVSSADVLSATVVLANARPGDVLAISGALPAGISGSVDTSESGQVTVSLVGQASAADYETALQQIVFNSTSDNPGSDPRRISVVVSDVFFFSSNGPQTTINVTPVNDAPTAVALANTTTSINENTDTGAGIKVADIQVADDDLGTNTLGLVGADAAFFEIVGSELRLKAGVLDFESKSSYSVQVTVDDPAIGSTPDATSTVFTVNVNNLNEPPNVTLVNTTTAFNENTDTSAGLEVADIQVADDGSGTHSLGLAGPDAGLFEIVGTELRLKAGVLDFETKASYSVRVTADDATIGGNPDATSELFIVNVTDVNEAPTAVAFANTTTSINENADATAGVKVADIQVIDDALGTETLTLVGADAAFFEIVGTELRLKAGVLDFESKSSYSVQVTADDTAVGSNPDATSALFTVNVTDIDEAFVDIAIVTALSVVENSAIGTLVGKVRGQDPDNRPLTYTLTDSAGGRFAIDNAGNISVANSVLLDFEQGQSHGIVVRVSDGTTVLDRGFQVQVTNQSPENVTGTPGGEIILTDGGNNSLFGLGGSDWLQSGAGNDFLFGMDGRDFMFGEAGNDWLDGGNGDDVLHGQTGNDTLGGGAGDDWLDGGDDDDTLHGQTGNDTLGGGAGNDQMNGGAGDDLMVGGIGNDVLVGEDGNDSLFGQGGADWLYGGNGDDQLWPGAGVNGSFGGAGNDTFVFDVATSDLDVIYDGAFGAGANDRVVIFNAGSIDTFAELMGNAYQDGSDVVIAFGPTSGIYIKNHTIAQLAVDDFLFA